MSAPILNTETKEDWAWIFYEYLGYPIAETDEQKEALKRCMEEITDNFVKEVKAWLEQKKAKKQITYDLLKGKANLDLIHKSMYLMSGSEIDCLDELLKELPCNSSIKKQPEDK